ncbi:MAG: flagellar hook-basal body protein [Firmicutes bacterium]|jgi:flagellar basal-body rod protein FlgG|nr:flagellar hook-basal body protein [Bacillota bacterium]
MFRALCNNLTGMRAFQYSLEQIADNMSNINTTGYKASHASFSELLYRNVQDRRLPAAPGAGALDPQAGKGVRISSLTTSFSQGALVQGSRPLDLAIEGEGFFRIIRPDNTVSYTRNGSFYLDEAANIVTAEGDFLDVPFNLSALLRDMDGDLGALVITAEGAALWVTEDAAPVELGNIQLYRFINPAGLAADRNGQYLQTAESGGALAGLPGQIGYGKIRQQYLERSNVDLAEEMVRLITTQRALQSNIRALITTDELWALTIYIKS